MKKLFLMLVVAVLLVSTVALPVSATPTMELVGLARYFPAETHVFAAVRTDDGFINALDALASKVGAAIPEVAPPMSLMELIDTELQNSFGEGATFAATIRPWLGDTAVMGVTLTSNLVDDDPFNDEDVPFMIAIAITDRAGAIAYLDEAFAAAGTEVVITESAGFTVYTDEPDDLVLAVGDDVILLSDTEAKLNLGGDFAPLNADATFTNTVTRLPEGDYNFVSYFDFGDILAQAMQSEMAGGEMTEDDLAIAQQFAPLVENFPQQAIGATILDDRSLVLDFVQPRIDPAVLEQVGLPVPPELGSVNLAFADNIPAGTPLIIHGTNLNAIFAGLAENIRALAVIQENLGVAGDPDFTPESIDEGVAGIEFLVRGATGLDLQEDILGWMTGDFAIYTALKPSVADAQSIFALLAELPVDFALLVENTDPGAAQAVVDGLQTALADVAEEELTVSTEDIAGTTVLVLTVRAEDIPFPVELLIGANNRVFALGTRNAVEFALNPGQGMSNDPAFAEAAQYVLTEPTTAILYAAGGGLMPIANLLTAQQDEDMAESGAVAGAVLGLLSSSSISASTDGSADFVRAVITLPE